MSEYVDNFIRGIRIFQKYMPDVSFSANHDIIYLGPSPELVSSRDKKALEALGFHEASDYECWGWFT